MSRAVLSVAALAGAVSALRRQSKNVKAHAATSIGSSCEDELQAMGASQVGAKFCCDAGNIMVSAMGFPPQFGIMMAKESFAGGGCPDTLGQTEAVVQSLNQQYASYDPEDETSSFGVGIHLTDSDTTLMNETWNMPCAEQCLLAPAYANGVCSIAISLLNKPVSKIEEGWKGGEKVSHLGLKVCMYPGLGSGGVVYTKKAVAAATRCAYAVDAYSTKRPNKGCGCLQEGFQCMQWQNGTIIGGWGKDTDDMVTPCACKSGGESEDPTLPNSVGDAKCYWEGERMRAGAGQTGIRKALAQQYNFRESNKKCWNELLLDATVTNKMMREDAPGTIAAFVIPYPQCAMDAKCRDKVLATRDHVAQEFGSAPIPIVGFNYADADAPFIVLGEKYS